MALQPYKGVDPRSVEVARRSLSLVANARVVVLEPIGLPSSAFYRPRQRYRAEKLLASLDKVPYTQVVGLTSKDISTTNGSHADWGIFGLGHCPGRSCVVSTFRLGRRNDRLGKVVVHEFGHTIGLPHCLTPRCLMNDAAGKAATVDAEKEFCSVCLSKADGMLRPYKA